jgi:hypothetical protein
VKDPKERMTVEEAILHPWIMSIKPESDSSLKNDDLRSNCSEFGTNVKRRRLDVKSNSFSRSAECTTHDSYEKCLFEVY